MRSQGEGLGMVWRSHVSTVLREAAPCKKAQRTAGRDALTVRVLKPPVAVAVIIVHKLKIIFASDSQGCKIKIANYLN